MRHLTICEFGRFLGVTSERLVVRNSDGTQWETPLSRLRTIRIAKTGISLSSDLIQACACRGIRLFFTDWRNVGVAAVSGLNQHSVVALRQAQFDCVRSDRAKLLSEEIIRTKVRNQRAVILYFSKYLSKANPESADVLRTAAEALLVQSNMIGQPTKRDWRETLLGTEGMSANIYWGALAESGLLPESFQGRSGRGATEIVNAALNYGYSILMSYVWAALDNAGLELYAGIFHKNRIGRASLVTDFMEEYRAWVVDRNIIKLRSLLSRKSHLDTEVKKAISSAIDETMTGLIAWRGKKIRLENVLQRQVYRFAGAIMEEKRYTGLRFKW